MRWPDGVQCPHCEGKKVSFLKSRRIWKCMAKECHKQFSVKTSSVFEDSPIPLDKWLTAVWLVVNCKNGVSSYEIMRDLRVTQKTAWFMLHRIRLALKDGNWNKLGAPTAVPSKSMRLGSAAILKTNTSANAIKATARNTSWMSTANARGLILITCPTTLDAEQTRFPSLACWTARRGGSALTLFPK